MKRKIICLSVAGITFVIGITTATIWTRFPHILRFERLSVAAPMRGAAKYNVCVKGFDINLGDSFDYVASVLDLTHDPNGPTQGSLWPKGRPTDFYSLGQPSVKIDKESQMNPAIFCTFDENRRLKSFSMSWLYEGRQDVFARKRMFRAMVEKEHLCWSPEDLDLRKNRLTATIDSGTCLQTFEYNFGERWTADYTIAMK
jgi:hypothetical protein